MIWAYKYVYESSDKRLRNNRGWIEQLPSLISTLGVIGTFVGITVGLVHFDENNLDASIPELLDGLKTAFFTSLFGMVGSLILSRKVNHAYDKLEGDGEIQSAAKQIVEAINALKKDDDTDLNSTMITLLQHVQEMKDDLEETKGQLQEINDVLSEVKDVNENQQGDLSRISDELLTASVVITKVGNDMDDVVEKLKESAK